MLYSVIRFVLYAKEFTAPTVCVFLKNNFKKYLILVVEFIQLCGRKTKYHSRQYNKRYKITYNTKTSDTQYCSYWNSFGTSFERLRNTKTLYYLSRRKTSKIFGLQQAQLQVPIPPTTNSLQRNSRKSVTPSSTNALQQQNITFENIHSLY